MKIISQSIKSPAEAVADIAACDANYFTVVDAMKGYHQVLLAEVNQLLTTYGISSISEHYDHHMAEAFTGFTGFCCIVDNSHL